MASLTLAYGLLLIIWGTVSSIGSESITSWVPAFIGVPIFIAGCCCLKFPAAKKIWMHVAVVFGLLAFLGGFRFFTGFSSEEGLFGNPKAAISQLMLLITGGFYTFKCVCSFREARKEPQILLLQSCPDQALVSNPEHNITNIILVDASESLNGSRVEAYAKMGYKTRCGFSSPI